MWSYTYRVRRHVKSAEACRAGSGLVVCRGAAAPSSPPGGRKREGPSPDWDETPQGARVGEAD